MNVRNDIGVVGSWMSTQDIKAELQLTSSFLSFPASVMLSGPAHKWRKNGLKCDAFILRSSSSQNWTSFHMFCLITLQDILRMTPCGSMKWKNKYMIVWNDTICRGICWTGNLSVVGSLLSVQDIKWELWLSLAFLSFPASVALSGLVNTSDGGPDSIAPSRWRIAFKEYRDTGNLGVVEVRHIHLEQQLFTYFDQLPWYWLESQAGPLEIHTLC